MEAGIAGIKGLASDEGRLLKRLRGAALCDFRGIDAVETVKKGRLLGTFEVNLPVQRLQELNRIELSGSKRDRRLLPSVVIEQIFDRMAQKFESMAG